MPRKTLEEKFKHYFNILSSPTFLSKEAIGGEIPFYIATYLPQDQIVIEQHFNALKKKLQSKGISVLEINLYDIGLEIIKSEDTLEDIFEEERESSPSEFLELMQSMLDIQDEVIPRIADRINHQPHQILFITGVGMVFPYLRSHNILNNLQRFAKDAPTVMLFPGKYNGRSLELFNLFKDDNYYRAFQLDLVELN